jgi:hypothetical protein
MENLCFGQGKRMAKGDLRFALLAGFCTADAAAPVLILKQWIITAAGAGKLSIFFDKDLDGYPCKSQRNEQYGKKNDEHIQIYRFSAIRW